MTLRRPSLPLLTLPLLAAIILGLPAALARGFSLDQLQSQLGAHQAREQSLSQSLGGLAEVAATLRRQIAVVQRREAQVQGQLAQDRSALTATTGALARERSLLVKLRAQLSLSRMLLTRQLISGYESPPPDVVEVVLNAHGFPDLLERLDFLRRAQLQQQSLIVRTRAAKTRADRSVSALAALEARQRQMTLAVALQVRAISGMQVLLDQRRGTLNRVIAAQQAALDTSRHQAGQLQSQIAQLRAQQAAAARAAARTAVAPGPASASAPASASGGWVIPSAIVTCESGGQNLPPNGAGASGYYQILPSTWQLYGGSGPAAYLAPKSEQDSVASRIWSGGGPSQWVCAGLVGIH